MGQFKYTKGEKEINKVLKMNQIISKETHDSMANTRAAADSCIAESEKLLRSLGMGAKVDKAKREAHTAAQNAEFKYKPEIKSWDSLVTDANAMIPESIKLEDILTPAEIENAFQELDEINEAFSRKTSIVNKTDLIFLAIATALQVTKSLLYPYVAQKTGYGDSFNPDNRLAHNDKVIEKAHKNANDAFKIKHQKRNPNGYWINMVYQTVPYDAIKGSASVGLGMSGVNHRLKTLGHDPILGWLFGTANILTDTITLNNFSTYRVTRNPLVITPNKIDPVTLLAECMEMIKGDKMNLPAALFTQAAHLKSDVYTKKGLPVPILGTFNESFATELYKNQYDALCLARDAKYIAGSAGITLLIDMIIGLVHSLFYNPDRDGEKSLYQVRTRKILLISNTLASSSSVISACITQNPKNLDIGGLLVTAMHLFSDIRFMAKVKKEYVEGEIDKKLQAELNELDALYESMV